MTAICGGGVVRGRAHKEFNEFVNLVDAPTAITVMGGGGMEGRNPHATGMIGMHGTKTSNRGVSGCDMLLALGARFSDRVTGNVNTFASEANIIQDQPSVRPGIGLIEMHDVAHGDRGCFSH